MKGPVVHVHSTSVHPDTAIDALTQYRADMVRAYGPLVVKCGSCYQPRGSYCRSSWGNHAPFHPERRRAIEAMPEAEVVAGIEEIRAARHAAVTATPYVLTPEQQAVRAATGAAWDALSRSAVTR